MSGLDFVDLTQIDSDTGSHSCENDDLYIVDVKIPQKRIKTEHTDDLRSESNAYIESIVAPTSAYTEVTGIPNTLMVLTEGRGIASEIAFCLFNLVTSQCMLSQFADSASYSRTIYAIVTSRPQVIFVPKAMAEGRSKAMLNIRKYLPWLTVVPFERKRFNDSEGYNVLQNIAIPSQAIQLTRVLHTKQYAYAALNALFYYLEHDLEITIASGSVNVTYKQMEGAMQIDPGATIYARQNAVLEILDNEKLFFFLSTQLAEFSDIDATITSLIRLPNAVTSRQINQAINNVLQVKHILQMAIRLSAGINIELRSSLLNSIVGVTIDNRISDLLHQIHAVIREDITLEKSAHMARSQRCHAIKLNSRLSSVVVEINLLTEKAIQDVASVIRENIVLLYRLSEAIALLDMIVSFACHCTLHDCVVPEFSDSISIIDGRHPILEALGREVVPNNVNTTAATFTIVSGPNMGGKSTYLRQIIYIVIMAQIGSL
ncbi:MutS protein msh4 [Coemansia sp. RSA 1365]|nr:MutS protein msh4 [Coemansia sp. RSA 1365]